MPFRDGSGPDGQGALTGRGMGNCAPSGDDAARSSVPGYAKYIAGAAGLFGFVGRRFFGRRGANRLHRNRLFNNRRR